MLKLMIPCALAFSGWCTLPQAATVDLTGFSAATGTNSASSISAGTASIAGTATLTGHVVNLTSFDWLFSTTDSYPINDYSYFSSSTLGTIKLADIDYLGASSSTGWNTYLLPVAYTGQIIFGVANDIDDNGPSALVIRNLVSAVPEPDHLAMLLSGLGLTGFVIRRRTRRPAVATT